MDEFVDVENMGCLGTIKDSIARVGGGIVMVLIAFPLLFWNEGRAVHRAEDLAVGLGSVVSVDAGKVDTSHNGDLLHISGDLKADQPAVDTEFGVSAQAIVLTRTVEMYQWKEDKKTKKKGTKKTTTYKYNKEWSSQAIDSSNFQHPKDHENPSMPFEGGKFYTSKASLGAYTLSHDLVTKWPAKDTYKLDEKALGGFGAVNGIKPKLQGSKVYYGDPAKTAIGDVRISYTVGLPGKASTVAGLQGNTLVKWTNEDLNGSIGMLSAGTMSAKQMFKDAADANTMMTWILRLVGFFLMFAGFNLITGPIDAIAGMVPLVGSLVDLGTTVISGLLAVALTLITIAVGWVFYRPIIGILLLMVGFGVIGAGIYLVLQKKKQKQPA